MKIGQPKRSQGIKEVGRLLLLIIFIGEMISELRMSVEMCKQKADCCIEECENPWQVLIFVPLFVQIANCFEGGGEISKCKKVLAQEITNLKGRGDKNEKNNIGHIGIYFYIHD